jgi:hypothetical protein
MTAKELIFSFLVSVFLVSAIMTIGSFSINRVEVPEIEKVKFKTVKIEGNEFLYGKLNRDLVLIPKCKCNCQNSDTIKISK